MPRDYKHINKNKKEPNPVVGNLISFATGLSLGLFVAFMVYLGKIHVFDRIQLPHFLTASQEQNPPSTKQKKEKKNVPSPTFDFYKILPNKEINISEYVADDEKGGKSTEPADNGIYVLQVGSFKDYDAADSVKARLTLLGIVPKIQRVVINGQDVRYRVRVGPFKNRKELDQTRRQLADNNMNFMLLKLQSEND
ncbi:MAG: SPOR domain-containing protein [Gammaproteobacteria bacterium]|jgi:cell division protein FtsN